MGMEAHPKSLERVPETNVLLTEEEEEGEEGDIQGHKMLSFWLFRKKSVFS